MNKKALTAVAATALVLGAATMSTGQNIVGSTQLGVSVTELRAVTVGWSAKRHILGKAVYNDKGDAIGNVDDIIVAPDKAVAYAIVGVGGFLGMGRHDVAMPVSQLKQEEGKFVLAGATKDVLKAMPAFEYER